VDLDSTPHYANCMAKDKCFKNKKDNIYKICVISILWALLWAFNTKNNDTELLGFWTLSIVRAL
jgi:hypothetical protein